MMILQEKGDLFVTIPYEEHFLMIILLRFFVMFLLFLHNVLLKKFIDIIFDVLI